MDEATENDLDHESSLQNRISVIPLGLGRRSLQQRLEAYYSLIAPDIIADELEWKKKFHIIYNKFGGSEKGERALDVKLCKKYGSNVRLRLGVNNNSVSDKANNNEDGVEKRDESWYDVSPSQRDSGIIDFVSERFDPIAALSLDSSKIIETNSFVHNVPLLDNISRFPPFLPDCDPLKRNANHKKRKLNTATSSSTTATKSQQIKRKLPILTSIAEAYQNSGPLSLLYNIHVKKQRIRILIRYADCIRSTITGYLLAFDKHMNMILRDVDEIYTPRVTKAYQGIDLTNAELELKRRTCITNNDNFYNSDIKDSVSSIETRLLKVKQRHFQQLLVRGDNIVMVWRASSERSFWPKTSISPDRSIYDSSLTSKGGMVSHKDLQVGTPGSLMLALQSQKNTNHNTYKLTKKY